MKYMKYYINLCISFAHTKYPKLSIHFYYISFHVYSTFYILQYFLHFFCIQYYSFPFHYKILTKYQSITFSFKLKRKRKKLYFQLTSFFSPIKYTPLIFHSPIHFSPMPFKKKEKKNPTFPIQLHSSHSFLTSLPFPNLFTLTIEETV